MTAYFKYFVLTALILFAIWGASGNRAFAQNTPQIDQERISEDFVLRLIQMTTRMRSVGIVDAGKINDLFTSGETRAFDNGLPEGDADVSSVLWSHFFRNTQIYYAHLKSPNPIVAYYDPFSDFFLLTVWDNSSERPVLVRTGVYPSEALTNAQPAVKPAPNWLEQTMTDPFLKVLPVFVGQAVRSFEERYPFDSKARAVLPESGRFRELFRDRQSFLFSTLLELETEEGISSVYLKTLDAVQSGVPLALRALFDGPTDMPVNDVAGFPEAFRNDLEPVLFLKGQGGSLIVSSREENGRWLLVSAFSDSPDPSLMAIGYLDAFAEGG